MIEIGIVPSIKETYKNQFEFSSDIKFNKFLNFIFKKSKIYNLGFKNNYKKSLDLIIFCGGNDLPVIKRNKANNLRFKLNNFIFKKAISNKIPILGICFGAQYLAYKFKSKFKKKTHIGENIVNLNKKKIRIKVNSYHNVIINSLGKDLEVRGLADDKSIEFFSHNKKKIIGIQWHPERYDKFKKIDKDIIKSLCS